MAFPFALITQHSYVRCQFYDILRTLFPSSELHNIQFDMQRRRFFFSYHSMDYCLSIITIVADEEGYDILWRLYAFLDDSENISNDLPL